MTATRKRSDWIEYWDSQAAFGSMMRIAAAHFFRRTQDLVGFGPGDVVLDIGCGLGDLEEHLVGAVDEIHGLDTSANMVSRCRSRFADSDSVWFHELDPDAYTDLSFLPASHFTRIICLSVVQYYQDRSDLLTLINSVRRIAAPGARLLVADIPTHSSPVADTFDLLHAAAAGGFLTQAGRFLCASFFSRYRTLRSSAGLLCYPRQVLESLVEAIPEPARIVAEPLTLSTHRVHLEVVFPDPVR